MVSILGKLSVQPNSEATPIPLDNTFQMTTQMFLLLILDQTPSFYSPEETRILALKLLPNIESIIIFKYLSIIIITDMLKFSPFF